MKATKKIRELTRAEAEVVCEQKCKQYGDCADCPFCMVYNSCVFDFLDSEIDLDQEVIFELKEKQAKEGEKQNER